MLTALILSVIDGGGAAMTGAYGDDLGLKESCRRIRSRALKLQSRRDPRSSERLEKLSDSIQQRISILSSTFEQDQVTTYMVELCYTTINYNEVYFFLKFSYSPVLK